MIDHDHADLLKILKEEESDAATYFSSELAQSQATAMDRYHARPYGDEVDGRSRVVTHDIEDTINWIMPALMRTFEPSDELITCDDDSLDDGSHILTATAQYIRHVFFKQTGGEDIIHDFVFDGLLQKVGVIRTAWEDARPSPPLIRENVTAEQLARYDADPEYQILEVTPDNDGASDQIEAEATPVEPEALAGLMAPPPGPQVPPGLMAAQMPAATPLRPALPDGVPFAMTYTVKLQRVPRTGKPVVETIRPEMFRISSRATSIDEAPYHGASFETFLSEVIGDYAEQAYRLDPEGRYGSKPDDEEELNSDTRVMARFPDEPDIGRHDHDDEYREKVWLKIEYLRCDYDRDDIVELRRIVRVGDVILENEIVEESEFTAWSPIRVAHRAIGRSIADTLIDIQKIRTVITRRAMDSLSQALTPRTFYDTRQAQNNPTFVDQLLDHDVGSAVGVDGDPTKAVMIQQTPDVSASAFQAIEYWDRRSEEASGVNRHAMGIQPQAITDTKGGIEALQSAANARVEQVARHVGKALSIALTKLLRVIVRHQHTPQIFKVSGKRVQWDARQVSDQMTVSVHVGMTAESREKRLQFLGGIAAKQEQILLQAGPSNPLVTIKHYRHTLAQMVNVGGYRDAAPFFAEIPEGWQPPPPGPDPKLAEAQGKMQLAQAEAQSKAQIEQAKLQAETQMKALEFQRDEQLQAARLETERAKNAAELESKRQLAEMQMAADAEAAARKAEYERQIAELKAANEAAIAQARTNAEMQLARERMQAEMELARWKTAQEVRVAKFGAEQKARAVGKAAKKDRFVATGSAKAPAANDTQSDGIPAVRFGGHLG